VWSSNRRAGFVCQVQPSLLDHKVASFTRSQLTVFTTFAQLYKVDEERMSQWVTFCGLLGVFWFLLVLHHCSVLDRKGIWPAKATFIPKGSFLEQVRKTKQEPI